MSAAPIDLVLSKLENPKGNGTQWSARCPAHEDRDPSLSIGVGEGDRVLLSCHAGCTLDEILAALGLKVTDLFSENGNGHNGDAPPRVVARYPYTDENGEVLFHVHRTDPKDFYQVPANGRRGKGAMDGVRRVLYRLPEVIAAVDEGRRVFIPEGEKDVDALVRAGEVGTCNPGGAGKWSKVPDAPEILTGARVVIVRDNDAAGLAHAKDVARSLIGKAASLMIMKPAHGKDVAEHLGFGLTVDELVAVAQYPPSSLFGPEMTVDDWLAGEESQPESEGDGAQERITPYDFGRLRPGGDWIIDAPKTVPAVWGRDDEVLWSEGEPMMLCGPPGVGKTTIEGQVIYAQLGLLDGVLGLPVVRAERILILAMDRPQQIRRSLNRLARPEWRDELNERVVIWPGPPPADMAKDELLLIDMARAAKADAVWLDSVKDAAIGLSDDAVGAAVNRAVQRVVADDIQIAVTHHQRKTGRDGGKPQKLEDVYGSVWLTGGMGSVVLLWGEAGAPVVELLHLKQPAGEVGPLTLIHHHLEGTTSVDRGPSDPLHVLAMRPNGITADELARLDHPTANEISKAMREKARRKLDALERKGMVRKVAGGRGGSDDRNPSRYFLEGLV
jgi:hypothetical protein